MAMAYSSGFNLDKLKVSLYRRADRVEEAVVDAVEEAAELIRDEARLNVPVDTHNLETAIHISDRRTRRGNHAVDIEVSGAGDTGRDVAEYAMEIHENYEDYNPGEKTLAKRAANPGRYVGEGYMDRAVSDKKPEAVDIVRKAMKEAMR